MPLAAAGLGSLLMISVSVTLRLASEPKSLRGERAAEKKAGGGRNDLCSTFLSQQ